MRERNELLRAQGTPPSDVQRQHVCGACGNIMVPGLESELKLERLRASKPLRKARRGGESAAAATGGPLCKVLCCGRCRSVTRVHLAGAPERAKSARSTSAAKAAAVKPPDAPGGDAAQKLNASSAANASSRRRTKSRKAGLQALLSSQQLQRQHHDASSRLSLADFRRE